jgi:hypothetical protein
LRAQIQIEVAKRRYTTEEQAGLRDLFGTPDRWGQTLKPLLWTNTSAVAPQFTGETTVDLQVPCTFDFSVATTKYFNSLDDGDIPVVLMFSGTVFYADEEGSLRVAPISWEKETKFRVPLKVWKDMMDAYYPNIAWLCLRRDCEGGEFVSLLDPAVRFKKAAAECQNAGAWPVLAGDEGQRDMMLASPIILYGYPRIAPESPGDLCDGLEIDEILALRILTMTLPPEHFQKLHGALRGLR